MDPYTRHQMAWNILYSVCHPWICRKFNLTHEDLNIEGPVLLIPNHTCAWDPLLVAMSLRSKQVYFVASEHIFRLGFVSRLIEWAVAPIPRRKASSGVDTVKACLRHLKAGHSICLFAEGEQCWEGRSGVIFPATGKLAKSSGATLVTFRMEGGYLSLPRWGKSIRRGLMHGSPVGIYPPEQLRTMTPQAINALIQHDIDEDAWERQKRGPVAFRGKRRAEGMEHALYLCPGCGRIGSLKTQDNRIFCDCGLDLRFTEYGLFSPGKPFRDISEWDAWQRKELHSRQEKALPGELLFSDAEMLLWNVTAGHQETLIAHGVLQQYSDRLVCGEYAFPLNGICDMAQVLASRLLFTHDGQYYELRAKEDINFRKYLEVWKGR